MSLGIKDRTLIAIGNRGGIQTSKDIRLDVAADIHNLAHTLYRLRRDGFIRFKENTQGDVIIPTKIRLTPRGEQRYQELS